MKNADKPGFDDAVVCAGVRMFSVGKAPPDYLIERIDTAVELLKKEVLGDAEG